MRYFKLLAFLIVLTIGVSCKKSEKTSPAIYKFTISLNGTTYSWTGENYANCAYSGGFDIVNVTMGKDFVNGFFQFSTLIALNRSGLGTFLCNPNTANAAVPNQLEIVLKPTNEVWTTTTGGSVTVNITEVSRGQFGIVKGNFSGTVQKYLSNTTATVSGTFEAMNGYL